MLPDVTFGFVFSRPFTSFLLPSLVFDPTSPSLLSNTLCSVGWGPSPHLSEETVFSTHQPLLALGTGFLQDDYHVFGFGLIWFALL